VNQRDRKAIMGEFNPLCFSTSSCPDWAIERVVESAGQWGYEGVEVYTPGTDQTIIASDPTKGGPDSIRSLFEQADIQISALATDLALHYASDQEVERALRAGRAYVDLATRLGTRTVRMFGNHIRTGGQRQERIRKISQRFVRLAEYAEEHGIEILVENAGSFAGARDLWQLMQHINHPSVGVCWNATYAMSAADEEPGISVPMLSQRLRYAKISDLVIEAGDDDQVSRPTGDEQRITERYIELLRGFGYDGWICFEWKPADSPNVMLARTTEVIREWFRPRYDKKKNLLSKLEGPVLEVQATKE